LNLQVTNRGIFICLFFHRYFFDLNRLFSEYLGKETMLGIVCKTYQGVKAIEMYDKEGMVERGLGLHGLGSSIGKVLQGRFIVFCLENLR
jgi:hypothetical protein